MSQTSLIAGDTFNYTATSADYPPADGWLFFLRLVPRNASAVAVTVSGVADGSDWLVQAAAGVTEAWAPGEYAWAAWVEKAAERYTIESGQLTVLPDPRAAVPGTDSRSEAELALANIQAVLKGRATAAIESYTINGRQLKYYPLMELVKLEGKYKRDVDRDRAAAGLLPLYASGPRRILVRCG